MLLSQRGRTGRPLLAGLSCAAAAVLLFDAPALAHPGHDGGFTAEDGARDAKQHGENAGHLPATRSNVDLVARLRLKNVVPEKIADVAVHRNHAYLGAWGVTTCEDNGVHVVDIATPAAPVEVGFIRSKVGSYPGEGVQVVPISTPAFDGDLLVTNNETCGPHTGYGGINLYDVTNPRKPIGLFEGAGDFTKKGIRRKHANQTHSAFAWDAGDRAYAVMVDNEEARDVDILDITNPKQPKLIAEYDLGETFPQILQAAPANLTEVFLHDMVVKQIDGRQVMLASYWDGGYVSFDVTDPRKPVYLGDTDVAGPDPELLEQAGLEEKPEGNAHQAEFTADDEYVIGADEDFSPNGTLGRTDDATGDFLVSQGSGTPQISTEQSITGTAVYVGRSCNGDAAVPVATGPGQIAVVARGTCFFTEKMTNIDGKGYAAAVVVNREGSDGCGPFGMSVVGTTPAFSVDRRTGFGFFDRQASYDGTACLAGTAEELPGVGIGTVGDVLTVRGFFDGWGYVHLYKNGKGKLADLDTYALPEAMNPAKAEGFGDLSVHEVATSEVDSRLAYFSYYSGGLRVARIVEDGGGGAELEEVGRFIDEGGSNFWGVQVFQGADGKEYLAASDRDHGLMILRYTGP